MSSETTRFNALLKLDEHELRNIVIATERKLEDAKSFKDEWHNPSDLLRLNELDRKLEESDRRYQQLAKGLKYDKEGRTINLETVEALQFRLGRRSEQVLALIGILDDHKVSTVDHEDSVIRIAEYEAKSGESWPPPELRVVEKHSRNCLREDCAHVARDGSNYCEAHAPEDWPRRVRP